MKKHKFKFKMENCDISVKKRIELKDIGLIQYLGNEYCRKSEECLLMREINRNICKERKPYFDVIKERNNLELFIDLVLDLKQNIKIKKDNTSNKFNTNIEDQYLDFERKCIKDMKKYLLLYFKNDEEMKTRIKGILNNKKKKKKGEDLIPM